MFWKSTLWIGSLYVVAASLVTYALDPVQFFVFPELPHLVSLIYIPSGIRVFATILFGVRAVPGIFFGTAFSAYFLSGIDNTMLLISISVVSASVAPLVFYCLQSLGINAYYLRLDEKLPKREGLLLAGFLTSVVNGFFLAAILEKFTDLEAVSLTMAGVIVGDFAGFLIVILLAKLTTRSLETKNR